MHIQLPFRSQGRFAVIKHTGHKFNEAGELVELGRELESTPLADNMFTAIGAAFWASVGPNNVSMNISDSGSPPSVSGPGRILRTSSALVSSSTTRSLVPNDDGDVWWQKTYRFSFPSSSGLGTVTIRQAIASVTGGPLTGGVTNGIVSAALLEAPGGGFTEVTVDMATEDLDVVWEYTEYFKPEFAGEFTVRTVDGFGSTISTSTHTYVIRPANLNNTADASKGWGALAARLFPALVFAEANVQLGIGTIGFAGSEITFSESLHPSSVTLPTVSVGASEYVSKAHLSFDDTTSTDEINCAQFMLGHTEWQVAFDPPVIKQSRYLATFSIGLLTR